MYQKSTWLCISSSVCAHEVLHNWWLEGGRESLLFMLSCFKEEKGEAVSFDHNYSPFPHIVIEVLKLYIDSYNL